MIWVKRVMAMIAVVVGGASLLMPSVDAGEKITLRIASVSGPQHHHNDALRWYAERVAKRSNNRLELRVLDGAQLGGERDYIEGMILGSIEMAQVSTGPIAGFIPEFDLFSLPYMFRNTDHFVNVIGGPVSAKFFELLEKRGIKGLCWFDNGYRSVFNSRRPIRTPEDMKGLKIRVMESPIMVDTINAMGGSATPMAYGELYTALQQGVLSGAENAPGNVFNDKFYEVTKYYSLTNHFRPPGVVVISLKVWNRLSKEDQAVLQEEAKALQTYEIDLTQKVERESLEKLKAKGMQINEVDFEAFQKAVKPVHEKFAARFGPDLIKQVLETK
jgi:tripartite ATP-independent transporter DctP family solute receptor